jgi:hypothetical protein
MASTETGSRSAAEIVDNGRAASRDAPPLAREQLTQMQQRQRDEFGGLQWGSAFFGWLVAVGIAALLTAVLSAAGAAVGLTQGASAQDATSNADTVGIVGGIVLLAILLIAYYAGGYVAGRMSRFSGPKQGIGVWIIALAVTVVLAVAGAVLGAEYNVLSQLNLPRIPIGEGTLTTGGLIALAAIVLGTLLAAVAGGKAGTHYHRKIDRAGAR